MVSPIAFKHSRMKVFEFLFRTFRCQRISTTCKYDNRTILGLLKHYKILTMHKFMGYVSEYHKRLTPRGQGHFPPHSRGSVINWDC